MIGMDEPGYTSDQERTSVDPGFFTVDGTQCRPPQPLPEEYGDGAAQLMRDEDWISAGTRAGYVLLAKDHRVARRPLEAQAIYMNDARVVAFARGELTATAMGDLCLEHQEAIHRLATVKPPFVMSLTERGLRRKHLNFP